jgi:hypothetical protein
MIEIIPVYVLKISFLIRIWGKENVVFNVPQYSPPPSPPHLLFFRLWNELDLKGLSREIDFDNVDEN